METIKDLQCPIKRITPGGGDSHYFFGYYDNPAFSGDDAVHLANRVSFFHRLPVPGDGCELCAIDPETTEVRVLARTGAWNFQQGAMLQWYPDGSGRTVAYNDYIDGDWRTVILDTESGAKRVLERPAANISPDGRYGLSINFSRVYDFRPGYGYCQEKDRWFNTPAPGDDGIYLMDMETGASRLIISYDRLDGLFNTTADTRGRKIVINHITFNRDSSRFVFLVRYFPEQDGRWMTGIGTSDLEGNIYVLRPYIYASHYFWKDAETLLIHADAGEGPYLYELRDQSREYAVIAPDFVRQDVHCSYSPDRTYIIGDGYPDPEGYRALQLYHIPTGKGVVLGRFLAPPVPLQDVRCDLHTRWNHAGNMVSFDSIHEGFRGIYTLDLTNMERLFV